MNLRNRARFWAPLAALPLGVFLMDRPTHGAIVFSENFNSYSPGNLVGQGDWVQLGASVVNPQQVTASNAVSLTKASSGQDTQKAFSTLVPHNDGLSVITEFDVTVTATGSGDFFAELTESAFGSAFFNRFYVRTGSVAGTIQFGISAGNPETPLVDLDWGADLPLGVSHHLKSTWNFVAGAANDTLSLDVNGSAYVAEFEWNTASDEPVDVNLFNLRQGGNNGPAIAALDNIVVTAIPEPASVALAAIAGLAVVTSRRKE